MDSVNSARSFHSLRRPGSGLSAVRQRLSPRSPRDICSVVFDQVTTLVRLTLRYLPLASGSQSKLTVSPL